MSGRADEDTRRWTLHIISSQGWISATVRSGWGREKKGKRGGGGWGGWVENHALHLNDRSHWVFFSSPSLHLFIGCLLCELARRCWRKCPFK